MQKREEVKGTIETKIRKMILENYSHIYIYIYKTLNIPSSHCIFGHSGFRPGVILLMLGETNSSHFSLEDT